MFSKFGIKSWAQLYYSSFYSFGHGICHRFSRWLIRCNRKLDDINVSLCARFYLQAYSVPSMARFLFKISDIIFYGFAALQKKNEVKNINSARLVLTVVTHTHIVRSFDSSNDACGPFRTFVWTERQWIENWSQCIYHNGHIQWSATASNPLQTNLLQNIKCSKYSLTISDLLFCVYILFDSFFCGWLYACMWCGECEWECECVFSFIASVAGEHIRCVVLFCYDIHTRELLLL